MAPQLHVSGSHRYAWITYYQWYESFLWPKPSQDHMSINIAAYSDEIIALPMKTIDIKIHKEIIIVLLLNVIQVDLVGWSHCSYGSIKMERRFENIRGMPWTEFWVGSISIGNITQISNRNTFLLSCANHYHGRIVRNKSAMIMICARKQKGVPRSTWITFSRSTMMISLLSLYQ